MTNTFNQTVFEGQLDCLDSKKHYAFLIKLNGCFDSDLNFEKEKILAQKALKKGVLLFWDLNLGLKETSLLPPLHLSIKQFIKDIWKDFSKSSIGLCLYRGKPTEKVATQLKLLSEAVDEYIPLFVMLDMKNIALEAMQAKLLNMERWGPFKTIVKNEKVPIKQMSWQENIFFEHDSNSKASAVLLPMIDFEKDDYYEKIFYSLDKFFKDKRLFRYISEAYLTADWSELDYLLYLPEALGDQGKRKLAGFCAAGGCAVSLGEKIGLANEITIKEFASKVNNFSC